MKGKAGHSQLDESHCQILLVYPSDVRQRDLLPHTAAEALTLVPGSCQSQQQLLRQPRVSAGCQLQTARHTIKRRPK